MATLIAFEPQVPRLDVGTAGRPDTHRWRPPAGLRERRQRGAGAAPHCGTRRPLPDERQPLAALPLIRDMATLTAIGNDYGAEQVFARQVRAHGRPGDLLVCLSSSGTSRNVIAAAETAAEIGVTALGAHRPRAQPAGRRLRRRDHRRRARGVHRAGGAPGRHPHHVCRGRRRRTGGLRAERRRGCWSADGRGSLGQVRWDPLESSRHLGGSPGERRERSPELAPKSVRGKIFIRTGWGCALVRQGARTGARGTPQEASRERGSCLPISAPLRLRPRCAHVGGELDSRAIRQRGWPARCRQARHQGPCARGRCHAIGRVRAARGRQRRPPGQGSLNISFRPERVVA